LAGREATPYLDQSDHSFSVVYCLMFIVYNNRLLKN
jgi:hypothetical protein